MILARFGPLGKSATPPPLLAAALLTAPASAFAQEIDLGYRVPATEAIHYRVESSTRQEMTSPLGNIGYSFDTEIILAATFAETPGGLRVSATVDSVRATVTGPLQTRELAPEIRGAYHLRLSPRGEVRAIALPELPGMTAAAIPISAVAHELFPRLPGTRVAPGHRWRGRVRWTVEGSQGPATTNDTEFRYMLRDDTIVAGRTLLKIELVGEGRLEAQTTMNGVSVALTASGLVEGWALWDPGDGVLHSMETRYAYAGSAATALGALPVTVRSRTIRERTRIADNPL